MTTRKCTLTAVFLLPVLSLWAVSVVQAGNEVDPVPIFDAHIHYSHDAWEAFSPHDAIRRLREAGVKRAMVSSSSDEGTQRLYQTDPGFVVPSLRPYRKRGELDSWMHDESVIPYIKERLQKYHYAAIGELHVDGEEANTPVMREVVRLAKQYRLMLHVHGDAPAIRNIFEQDPDARILWAHAGFEFAETVRELLVQQDNLWADLSFRYDVFPNGTIMTEWKELLVDHADRFLLGIDTYTPQRWLQVNEIMQWQRQLLATLPNDAARMIAYENGDRITRQFDGR
ncbi:MAG: amidohydrolase [Arenicellales bacterium]